MTKIEQIKPFAKTDRERLVLNLLSQGYTQTQVADKMGISRSTVQTTVYALRDRAEVKGVGDEYVSGEADQSDTPFYVKGTSTLYDAAGNPKLQWVKTHTKADALDKIAREIVEALKEDISGKSEYKMLPKRLGSGNTMNMVVMGDPHIGVFAKEKDGKHFGLKENLELHRNSISTLLETAPEARECIILSVGDTLHSDNPSNRTTRSGASLDVDTDWYTCIRETVGLFKYAITKALETHQTVKLVNLSGNHDDYSGYCLNLIMEAYYNNNPRVIIETSESRFMYHRFGNNLFGFVHGDSVKIGELESIMAHDMKCEWDAEHKYFHTGHIHHKTVQEFRSVTVESHRTLASNDRWHMDSGYRSKKEMKLITYDKEHGEVGRSVVTPKMF